jgi:hypothetical protein
VPIAFAFILSDNAPLIDDPTEPPDTILSTISDDSFLPLIELAVE